MISSVSISGTMPALRKPSNSRRGSVFHLLCAAAIFSFSFSPSVSSHYQFSALLWMINVCCVYAAHDHATSISSLYRQPVFHGNTNAAHMNTLSQFQSPVQQCIVSLYLFSHCKFLSVLTTLALIIEFWYQVKDIFTCLGKLRWNYSAELALIVITHFLD